MTPSVMTAVDCYAMHHLGGFQMGWVHAALFSLILASALEAKPLTRIIYSDDPILEVPRQLLEEAYGAKIFVIPVNEPVPDKPVRLEGTVLHLDPEDRAWVMGQDNPMLEQETIKERILRDYDLDNIEDKWDEWRFLAHFPEIASPEMHLGSDYTTDRMTDDEKAAIEPLVDAVMKKVGIDGADLRHDLTRLEFMRQQIEKKQGRSILKIRNLDHSEGRLPKTNKNWLELFANYMKTTKPEMDRLRREHPNKELQDEFLKLPHLEGRALDALLTNGNRVIVHSMVKLRKELRIHIVDGKILPNATFLRFYKTNEYVRESDIEKIHEAVQTHFLDKLSKNVRRLNLTPDVIIEQQTGRVRIIDLNMGIYSGYYYAEEDLFTTNALTEHYTGIRPPFLDQWDEVTRLPLGSKKSEAIRKLLEKFAPLMKGDVAEAFWDRVQDHYLMWLRFTPTAANFDLCLKQFQEAGLNQSSIFHQFIAHAQSLGVRLNDPDLEHWQKTLDAMDPKLRSIRRGNTLTSEPRVAKPRGCADFSRTLADAA